MIRFDPHPLRLHAKPVLFLLALLLPCLATTVFSADRQIVEYPVVAGKNVKNTQAISPVQAFRITGRVFDRDTGQGLAGYVVKAVDKDLMGEQLLGKGTTDSAGRYDIRFPSPQSGSPNIVVRVFDQKDAAFGESALYSNAPVELVIDLAIVPTTRAGKNVKKPQANRPIQNFRITGRVFNRNTGQGLAGYVVKAVDKELLDEQLLGNGITDSEGRYDIMFRFRQIFGGLNIVMRVFDQKDAAVGESAMYSNVPAELTIDLAIVPAGKNSSFGRKKR